MRYLLLLLLLNSCAPSEPQESSLASSPIYTPPAFSGPKESPLDGEELAFVSLINQYRAQNGLGSLAVSRTLEGASEWMSGDMTSKNYFSHTDSLGRDPFVRMSAFGYSANYRGETIAAGYASAADTFQQWKNSPTHNAIMLGGSYKVLGVGRAYNAGAPYGWYWTADFGSAVDSVY